MTQPQVLISEVGPRDGLQSVKATMPTADKLRWIDALVAAGLREIEVGSFVPARLLPRWPMWPKWCSTRSPTPASP
jgi:hydroxymethylglutaryl-CoA lyase